MKIKEAVTQSQNNGFSVYEYFDDKVPCDGSFVDTSLRIGEVRDVTGYNVLSCDHKGDKKPYLSFSPHTGDYYDICKDCLKEMDKEELKDRLTFLLLLQQ